MRKILVGGAWPYANGSLHIGHIAGLLPGDVIARYHRALGDEVYFVSGSDCHGTPVAIRAKQENKTPRKISDHYHEEFTDCFQRLGFSYDCYTKTSSPEHIDFVQRFHKKLYESEYVYEKESPQAYCESCDTFLADRFVTGICPKCGAPARGDQCDACGTVLEPENLKEPICAVCGKPIKFRNSKHLYIAISRLEKKLRALVEEHPEWLKNAIAFIAKYYDGIVPEGTGDAFTAGEASASASAQGGITTATPAAADISARIDALYASAGKKIESGDFRDCLGEIFEFVRFANKYFDTEQPWITRTSDPAKCKDTLYHCVQIIANLAVLLAPFLPFSSEKLCRWLGIETTWKKQHVPAGYVLPEISILFERIDKKVIAEESGRLSATLLNA